MIIIIEGENKTGKSTLARYILEHHKFNYLKFSQPKRDPFDEYCDALTYTDKLDGNWIFDRFLIGEMVYGPLYRKKAGLDKKQYVFLLSELKKRDAFVVYCHDTADNIAERFDLEKEDFAEKKKIKKTLDLFDKQLRKTEEFLPIYYHRMKTENDLLLEGDCGIGIDYIIHKNIQDGKRYIS